MPRPLILALLLALAAPPAAPQTAAGSRADRPVEAAFWLLPAAERERLASADEPNRAAALDELLARAPGLEEAVARRRRAALEADLSLYDERAQLLFLRGAPAERRPVECASTFRQLELWSYGAAPSGPLIFVRQGASSHAVAWRPTAGKRVLYVPEMEYYLEQFEELRGRIRGKRPDRQLCREAAEEIDRLTGVSGLFDYAPERPTDAQVAAWFEPPGDLAAWAREVLAEPDTVAVRLPEPEVRFAFPAADRQRLVARIHLTLPPGTPLGVAEQESGRESRLALASVLDRPDEVFGELRTRFVFPPPSSDAPVVLELGARLRPNERFVARFELRDEVGGGRVVFERPLVVPAVATPEPRPAGVVGGQALALAEEDGGDSIVLLPPLDEVLFGLWRAEAIVAGANIERVVFYLNGKAQLTRGAPPWSAELRLPMIPEETLVRVEGLDAAGRVLAADEMLLNEPQGEPRVKLLAPARGERVSGPVRARAAVVVPEGRRLEGVEFLLNEAVVARLERPPWEATIDVPASGELNYLTVVATFEDGTRVEDLRVLNADDFLAEIDVDLVELYVTVTERDGRLVEDLAANELTIADNGRPQKVERFELVRDLPLTLGLVLDTSGSMSESIGEAKRAAGEFLAAVLTARDRCFAIGFSARPAVLMPLTADALALNFAFRDLPAIGMTSLHDAIVYGLYQYRGVRGRKAMVLLSDGDDTSSVVPFADALAFAQRSGVAIYTIGLNIGGASLGVRGKLEKLAVETGGRTFYIEHASELAGVYESIERELRSQYFVAFAPDPPPKAGERHTIEVAARKGRLKARTARGYTP